MDNIKEKLELLAFGKYNKNVNNLTVGELYDVLGTLVISNISPDWQKSMTEHINSRRAYYFSAEFLVGQPVYKNLMCLDIESQIEEALSGFERSLKEFEALPDEPLGNGGLGRLAACFLDSAANLNVALDGYGIKYRFGLFKQEIENGFQIEKIYNSFEYNDPWCVPCKGDKVKVSFSDGDVWAVPYDMPIISFKTRKFSTLRLWQCESINEFDFALFSEQKYTKSLEEKNNAENISRLLYPNDSTLEGKKLRFKQQYFFTSASLQDIIKKYKKYQCDDYNHFSQYITIQLNDTHPVVAIPELIRLLTLDGCDFDYALNICRDVFNYTNHTIMPEALEKWDLKLIDSICPDIARIIIGIDKRQSEELSKGNFDKLNMQIIRDGTVNMAYLACYVCKYINGVAELHTKLLKESVLPSFFEIYPDKFQNKTNGITFRRWLLHSNPQLTELIISLIGDGYKKDATQLEKLLEYKDNEEVLNKILEIKDTKKMELKNVLRDRQNISINENSIFDIQIKRLHEYKRQQLNALYVIHKYLEIKAGKKPTTPITVFFGAKAAPAYIIAQDIIHLILCLQELINNDHEVNPYLNVVMVENYNVTWAEKLIPACDISEQISLASKEASGTGNMKFMLNGAVTLGTEDGANVEIHELVGDDNIYIFGDLSETVVERYANGSYNAAQYYNDNAQIKEAVDFITGNELMAIGDKERLERLSHELIWKDWFMTFPDFDAYVKTREQAYADYENRKEWAKKMLVNIAKAGYFSSDRTIEEYNRDIWKL